MSTYHIQPIGQGLVQVCEEEVSYCVSREQAEEGLAEVQAHPERYRDDIAYLRRVMYYEEILAAMPRS